MLLVEIVVMEETEIGEVGVDKLHEEAHEKARERKGHAPWLKWLALSTALFAVLAAIASLKSGQLANKSLLLMNEATLKQAQASDAWSYYQAKGIKQIVRDSEADLMTASHVPADLVTKNHDEAERYRVEQEKIQEEAKGLEQEREELQDKSRHDLERHHTFAYAVTILQVAIGLSAIAALIERRSIWLFGLVCGIVGIGFLVVGFI
jgi:lipopolysaccharide export LptBFGC system permease protein LptF